MTSTISFKKFSIIMWCDEQHDSDLIISCLNQLAIDNKLEFAFILHDKDVYCAEDYFKYMKRTNVEPEWRVGDLKPKHYHIYLSFDKRISLEKVRKLFNVSTAYIEHINNGSIYVRYLIHEDNPEKYQYNDFMVQTNINDIDYYFRYKGYSNESSYNFHSFILELLEKNNYNISFKDLAKCCLENGFSHEIMKYTYFVKTLLDLDSKPKKQVWRKP